MNFLRHHRLDAVLVVLAVVTGVSAAVGAGGWIRVGGFVGTLSLLVLLARRWQPLAVSVLSFVGIMIAAQASPKASGPEFFAVLLVFGVAGALPTRRDALIAWGIGCLTFGTAMSRNPYVHGAGDIALTLTFCSLIWGAGLGVSERSRAAAHARERAENAESSRDDDVREATVQERARIATELHDIVSHGLSIVVVQTVAARMALEDSGPPEQIDHRLDAVESTAREALADMRRLLGLLQPTDLPVSAEGASSSIGLAQVPALAEQLRAAGTPVELDVDASLDLPVGLDAAAYRIIQEALTNVLKHASGSAAKVSAIRENRDLVISIESAMTAGGRLPGSGRGLIGMRQRAELYDGTLVSGQTGDSFRVCARIPLPTDDNRPRTFVLRGRRKTP